MNPISKLCRNSECGRAGELLPLTEFYGRGRDGLRTQCKVCILAAQKLRRGTPEYRAAERQRQATPEYRAARKLLDATPEYKEAAKVRKSTPKAKATIAANARARRSTAKGKLECLCRSSIDRVHKAMGTAKSDRTFEELGYSAADLGNHVASLFLPGMTPENYGVDWVLDHIRPISSFPPGTPAHVVNALSNLQPLTPDENFVKSNKYDPLSPEYLRAVGLASNTPTASAHTARKAKEASESPAPETMRTKFG